jgi:hypothetical protein
MCKATTTTASTAAAETAMSTSAVAFGAVIAPGRGKGSRLVVPEEPVRVVRNTNVKTKAR